MSTENLHLWHSDRGTYVDRKVNIITWSDEYCVRLGKYNSIGRNCNFLLHANHRHDWITTSPMLLGPVNQDIEKTMFDIGHPSCKGDIVVENDVWIGAESTILSGVKVSNGAVIAATSTVTKDVPPYAIVGGNPAKILKYRFTPLQIELLLKIEWWNWDENKIKTEFKNLWSTNIDDFIQKHIQSGMMNINLLQK